MGPLPSLPPPPPPPQAKLDVLNSIVWPEIWRLVEDKVQEAGSHGYRVCVVDAAVLVMAGWHRRVHQVWTTICPPSEVWPTATLVALCALFSPVCS